MPKSAGRKRVERRAGRAALGVAIVALALLGPLQRAPAERARLDIGQAPPTLIPPHLLVGEWLTIVRTEGKPQPVRLRIHTIEPGKTAGKLIYSSPRRCVVDLEYGGPDGDLHIFYIVPFTNCFRYTKTDFVALGSIEPLAGAFRGLSAEAEGYRDMPRDQRAGTGAPASDADSPGERVPTSRLKLERMEYVINLGGRPVEDGLLTRQ